MSPSESISSPASAHLELLRGQVRAALLTKRKGEARHLLGQLVSLASDQDAKDNLKTLVSGVSFEVASYESRSGFIRERLANGIEVEVIRTELDNQLPHWRAFTGDVPVLLMAKNGMEDRENPLLKEKVSAVAAHLKTSCIPDALELWAKLGEPTAAADGMMVQIIELVAKVQTELQKSNWQAAQVTLDNLRQLAGSSQAAIYEPGLSQYVGKTTRLLGCETLLMRSTAPVIKKDRERRALLEEIMQAKGELETLAVEDSTLLPYKERMDEAIERLSGIRIEETSSGKLPVFLALGFMTFVGAPCLLWYFNGKAPFRGDLHPLPYSEAACGGKPSAGDVSYPMPNGYSMLFRKIYLGQDMGHVKFKEYDQSESKIRAPFKDDGGRSYFLMGKTEVTVGQYSQFMAPEKSIEADAALPVRLVTVEDAENFCKKFSIWLGQNAILPKSETGKFGQIRLPASAEWEYAARGGCETLGRATWNDRFGAYPSGKIAQFEWFAGPQSSQGKVRQVALLPPNRLGLTDMLGNVREMTLVESSGHKEDWMRGGDISVSESGLTPALKVSIPAMMPSGIGEFRQEELGFRVAISVPADWTGN